MDSRWLFPLLCAGWLLSTLGVWGAAGRPWWLWPLSAGVGVLAVAGAGFWAMRIQMKAAAVAKAAKPVPDEVRA